MSLSNTSSERSVARLLPPYQNRDTDESHYQYFRYTTEELEDFAISRGLKIANPGGRLSLRSSIIDALQRAGDGGPFRFLDLPAELRNLVYEELLITKKRSLTCHPQILRTCKQIQDEANDLLYAENKITVRVYSDRVEAHGIRCGSFVPVSTTGKPKDYSPVGVQPIVWPEFLHRAWFIDVDVPDKAWFEDEDATRLVDDALRKTSIGNIFYSLCSELSSKHCCRKISFDDQLPIDAEADELLAVYYPQRLLGARWNTLENEDMYDNIKTIPLQDKTAFDSAAALRKGLLAPKAMLIRKLVACINKIITSYGASKWAGRYHACRLWSGGMWLLISHTLGNREDAKLDKDLKGMVWLLRELMGDGFMADDDEFVEGAKQLLLLEIELRV